jgi:hypothetical protein
MAGYRTEALFADLPIEESVRRTAAAHRQGHDEYRTGRGFGGRYIPPEAIRALALPPAERACTTTPARRPAAGSLQQNGGFPGSEVTSIVAAYHAGTISLADPTRHIRMRQWPPVPPACPPELQEAASAVDDPEPYVPGSFDDVVLAYDLGRQCQLATRGDRTVRGTRDGMVRGARCSVARTAPAGELVLLSRRCRSGWLTAARPTGDCGMSGHRAPGYLARRATCTDRRPRAIRTRRGRLSST